MFTRCGGEGTFREYFSRDIPSGTSLTRAIRNIVFDCFKHSEPDDRGDIVRSVRLQLERRKSVYGLGHCQRRRTAHQPLPETSAVAPVTTVSRRFGVRHSHARSECYPRCKPVCFIFFLRNIII